MVLTTVRRVVQRREAIDECDHIGYGGKELVAENYKVRRLSSSKQTVPVLHARIGPLPQVDESAR